MNAQQRRPAGRPRKFDTDLVLDRVLDLFWERGFRETSTRDLERSLGITQSSLYNAFGSKQELLLAAVDRYEQQVEADLLTLLDSGDGLDAIDIFLEALGEWIAANERRGCLVVNLMALETQDAQIAQRVVEYRSKIRRRLAGALARVPDLSEAQRRDRTDLLLAAVLGLHITARSGGAGAEIESMLTGLRRQVEGWRPSAVLAP